MSITRNYQKDRSDLVCDYCNQTIASAYGGIMEAEDQLPRKEYQDLNWGHECSRCRKGRERRYDAWATTHARTSV